MLLNELKICHQYLSKYVVGYNLNDSILNTPTYTPTDETIISFISDIIIAIHWDPKVITSCIKLLRKGTL